jgi:uncharacterized membrane protein
MVESNLNKKIVLSIFSALVMWLVGIIVAPMFAASGLSLGQKIASFMYFFYKPVCHQISDRSFWLDGFAIAVCIRCFSFYFGGLFVTSIYLFKEKIHMWTMSRYILFILPALLDFLLEKMNFYTNIAGLRLFTGFLLGIAIFHLLLVSLSTDSTTQEVESLT